MGTAAACSIPYGLAGELVPPTERPLATRWDAAIPFMPETVWLYLPGYVLLFVLTLVAVRRADHFRAACFSLLVLAVLAAPFFMVFPVAGPRPPTPTGDDPASLMIRFIHTVDPVGNTFPSLHVANAALCAWLAWQADRRLGGVVAVLAVGVALSTVTLKQHWLVDIPAGALLSLFGVAAWKARIASPVRSAEPRRAPEPAREVVRTARRLAQESDAPPPPRL